MRTRSIGPHRRVAGFSLIEVLVALVIFSFGMLGLAGLQTRMLTFSQSSLQRSQAMALTDDILDRMRLDRANAINGAWNTSLEDASGSIATGAAPAQFDLIDWKQEVETLLTAGRASIVVDAVNGNNVTITIEWNDSRGADPTNVNAGAEEFITRTRL
jgi:type IV pilus assembly protein PilV